MAANVDHNISDVNQNENIRQERLSFVDFYPNENSSYVKLMFSKSEVYDDLICKANGWLQVHPEWQAKTVESFLFSPIDGLGKLLAHSHHIQPQRYLFGVRLWICPKINPLIKPIQQLKAINVIPKIKITGNNHQMFIDQKGEKFHEFSSLNYPTFESISDIVENLNQSLRENKYKGQILNIETIALPVKSDKWSVNAQDLEWPSTNFKGALYILRVHLDLKLIKHETIEILDFVPNMQTWNAPLAVPNLESFTNVMKRASSTLKQRKGQFRFLNCNTVFCPTNYNLLASNTEGNSTQFIKPKKTLYKRDEWLNCEKTFSSKFVRIAICKPTDDKICKSLNQNILNCKIFIPSKELHISQYQNIQSIKKQVESWFSQTDVEILSIETEVISSSSTSISLNALIDACLNLKKFPCDLLVIFKVYINGYYIEPFK